MELSDGDETDGSIDGTSAGSRDTSRTADRDDDQTADRSGDDEPDRTLVVAQGTFDILHPGHAHYLRDAASMGDELVVIVARRSNVDHKAQPICPATQRRDIVDALEPVDRAILGHESDIFVPIEELDPDVIALGHDQHHDEDALADELAGRNIECDVRRASGAEPADDELYSSRQIVERIIARRR
ncbi:cytidyltransferase-related domain-containing protein [Halovivax asiaticus JCM 14624]|uniref:FAD synthase n=1 Tax=Halovivax asiaticus JCM 14624 TaxID=1227490 RepID=M0BRA4_9EURY|nr:adenylyltransferase/cytidyltransferase family protein [Halovivax asiaticus]ELZ12647.1 cytidyltransferase-related domain-containing protein [Halovivax asiaticus JCM 14624]